MEEELTEIKNSLAHIESLLQRMPEMIAAAFLLVKESADWEATLRSRPYSEIIELPPVNQR